MSFNSYKLLDAGNYKKLEQFAEFKIVRPCPQAFWEIKNPKIWKNIDADYQKSEKKWKIYQKELPESWQIQSPDGLIWQIQANESGNLGVFTEHWQYNQKLLDFFEKTHIILNLFSYTGSNSLPLTKSGYQMTVVDSSRSAMTGFVKNLELNQIERQGKRLILEDVRKFMQKEIRRKKKYNSILLDPPSFGKGTKNEVFNLEKDFSDLLDLTNQLLSPEGKIVLSIHSTGFNLKDLKKILEEVFPNKDIKIQKIQQTADSGAILSSGLLAWIGGGLNRNLTT